MKNFVVLFSVIFAFVALMNTGCETRVIENHFWECTNCDDEGNCEECIESEHDPRPDSVEKESDDAVAKDDDTIVNEDDSVAPDSDGMITEEENDSDSVSEEVDIEEADSDVIIDPDNDTIFPDVDTVVNSCEPIHDTKNESAAGGYSDGKNSIDTTEVLKIFLTSQTADCSVRFTSSSPLAAISDINNFSVVITKLPVEMLDVVFQGFPSYFFMGFNSSNILSVTIYKAEDYDTLYDWTFIPLPK